MRRSAPNSLSGRYEARLQGVLRLCEAEGAPALSAERRHAVAEAWTHRARAELTASLVFARIHEELRVEDADPTVIRLASQAIEDERFHSILATRVASHYLGAPVQPPTADEDPLAFESCDGRTARLLRVVLHSVLNETIATAYLRECLRNASTQLVRGAVRELLRDEVDHARLGWAHLASPRMDPLLLCAVDRDLPNLLSLVLRAWSKPLGSHEHPAGYGLLDRLATEGVVRAAIRKVILPGLRRVGVACSNLG